LPLSGHGFLMWAADTLFGGERDVIAWFQRFL